MPRIYYSAENYNGNFAQINTPEISITCKKADLYRAIVTVGNPSFLTRNDIRQNGLLRAISNSILEKIALVYINIHRQGQNFALHPIFNGYVSDKKRTVSYNLGMAVAKLYAEKLLAIPNLIHVETLKKQNAITFVNANSKIEPDLVGQTANGNWHAFEAKGASRNNLNTKILEAKNQASQIATIHGTVPSTLSACATWFSNDKILSRIEDPQNGEKKDIEIDYDKYYRSYYNPFYALQQTFPERIRKTRIQGEQYSVADIRVNNNLQISIGLADEVNDLMSSGESNLILQYYSKNSDKGNQENRNFSIGMDGFVVGVND